MRAYLVILTAVVGLGLCGCSKKEAAHQETSNTETQGMMPKIDSAGTSVEAAPMSEAPQTPVEGISLDPYFDEAGTRNEIAVKPGEQFKLYVMAHTVEPYPTTSAQLRLQLPPGITVLYTVETEHKMSSLGRYDFNYMIVYDCTPPGRFVVVSYVLQADTNFKGGKVEVLPGILADNATFLGFATCEFMEVRASGGAGTIKLKA